jgi:hypothetical protein
MVNLSIKSSRFSAGNLGEIVGQWTVEELTLGDFEGLVNGVWMSLLPESVGPSIF